MRRAMLGVVFAALSLLALMLVARVSTLRQQIARLQGERSEPHGIVVTADAPPPAELPDAIETAMVGTISPPSSIQAAPGDVEEGLKTLAPNMLRVEQRIPILADMPVVGGLFRSAVATLDPYAQAGLTEGQRARVIEWERQRDVELDAVRKRWEAFMEAELTPEQRAKYDEQRKPLGIVLKWGGALQEIEKP